MVTSRVILSPEFMMVWKTSDGKAVRRYWRILAVITVLTSTSVPALADEKPAESTEAASAQRSARLASMKTLAAQFVMKSARAGDKQPFELHPDPIFRYSDQPRGFVDATLWSWGPPGSTGRPAAIAKIEAAVSPGRCWDRRERIRLSSVSSPRRRW